MGRPEECLWGPPPALLVDSFRDGATQVIGELTAAMLAGSAMHRGLATMAPRRSSWLGWGLGFQRMGASGGWGKWMGFGELGVGVGFWRVGGWGLGLGFGELGVGGWRMGASANLTRVQALVGRHPPMVGEWFGRVEEVELKSMPKGR